LYGTAGLHEDGDGVATLPLLGRDRELRLLDDLIDGTPDRGEALLVRGEAGIGKRVCEKGIDRARWRGRRYCSWPTSAIRLT
jgi:hypothetical protein